MKRKRVEGETSSHKSAAQFFSEHQQIAGFDNVSKHILILTYYIFNSIYLLL
jgi:hypothetical protein